jgi:hypothetical protein
VSNRDNVREDIREFLITRRAITEATPGDRQPEADGGEHVTDGAHNGR